MRNWTRGLAFQHLAIRHRRVRTALLLACSLPAIAAGQDPGLEEVIVTGSRIARPDFESASPIVSITQQSFERTKSTTVDTVINRLPQFTPDMTGNINGPTGGQSNLQLRGLSPWRTLVLMDGRRLIPANGNGVVDTNIIPPTLVESVEVITGGASAVYGSDAIAGVVNFRLLQDFEGLRFDGGWGITDRGDGDEYFAGFTGGLGFANGRGKLLAYVGYSEREDVTQAERDFSRYALGYFGPGAGGVGPDGGFLPLGSTLVAEGRPGSISASQAAFDDLFESYGYPAGTVPYQTFFGVNQDGSLFTMGTRAPGSVVNFRGERDPVLFNDRQYTYNFAPWNYLQLPLERVSAFASGSFEIGAGHEVYGQALYADYSAVNVLAPTPANTIFMPVSNPYVPPDLAFLLGSRDDPVADFRIAKRFEELGPRIASNQYDVYQLTAGVTGPLFESWTYDAYLQYGENDLSEKQSGNALRSRINDLVYAPDGGTTICGEFDILRIGRISSNCANYIAVSGTNRQGYEQTVFEATASGPAFALPAGEVRLVLGVMYKRDAFSYKADPVASVVLDDGFSDIIGFNAADDIDGSDHNTDLYVEALLPLLGDLPGVQRLELVLGYRHSEYESAGGADSWKAELLYQPVDALRLRGSLQHAVRVASVFELYMPRLPWFYGVFPQAGGVTDPCEVGSSERSGPDAAQVEALCLDQGVPAALLPEFVDQDQIHQGVQGGNPELGPETGDTLTLGFAWTPRSSHRLFSGMQLSVDWYRIEMEDAIEWVFAPEFVSYCFDPRTNPGYDPSSQWCTRFSRDTATGEIVDFVDTYDNIAGFELSGVDLQIDWSIPSGPGHVTLNALVAWTDTFKLLPPPGLGEVDNVGTVGGNVGRSFPEWKTNVNLHYDWASLGLGLQWRYVDAMLDADVDLDYEVSSYDTFDLNLSYSVDDGVLAGLSMRAGIENLTDEEPLLLPSSVGANTDPSQYDVLGRRYYVNLGYRF